MSDHSKCGLKKFDFEFKDVDDIFKCPVCGKGSEITIFD